jgi:DNA-binding MarR family transcriptional regulator
MPIERIDLGRATLARNEQVQLDDSTEVNLRPVIAPDPLDLRISLSSLVHWADSNEVRRRIMTAVSFPVDDMAMFLVVNQLSYRGAMRPSDLASALGTGRANLSKIAHRLQEAGLITRVAAPGDDRSVLIVLTTAGREIGSRIMIQAQNTFESALAHWSADEIATLQRVLARLAQETVPELRQAALTS